VQWSVIAIPSITVPTADGTEWSSGVVDLKEFDSMLSGNFLLDDCGESINNSGSDSNNSNDNAPNNYLNPKDIAMVCITHVPTNSGIVNPVYEIGERINKFNERQHRRWKHKLCRHYSDISDIDDGDSDNCHSMPDGCGDGLPSILYLVDACQSAGQLRLDVQEMHCHALTATGRKYLRGPRGTGFLYVRYDIANALPPSHIDHAAAPVVSVPSIILGRRGRVGFGLEDTLYFEYGDGASRFEFWESSLASRLGLGEAVRYALEEVGIAEIESRCLELARELRVRLRLMDGVVVHHDIGEGDRTGYSDIAERVERVGNASSDVHKPKKGTRAKVCGIVTFAVRGSSAASVKETMMARGGFEISVVPATSTPIDSANTMVGDSDLVRVSLSYMNKIEEIEEFCDILRSLVFLNESQKCVIS